MPALAEVRTIGQANTDPISRLVLALVLDAERVLVAVLVVIRV